jgi:exosortase
MGAEMKARAPYLVFACLCAVSTAVLFHSFAATLLQAARNDEYTHILLILPVSATLIFCEWSSLKPQASPSPRAGAFPLIAGILVAVSGAVWQARLTPDLRLCINMLALVIVWIAAFILCFGTKIARSLLFPLCFLLCIVPIPAYALARIVEWLQTGSAFCAWLLFWATGVPTSRDGILLSIPGLNIEVAQECSSIRSSLMLLVTAMVLAHVLLRMPWNKLAVISLAVPLSIAKNGLRIFTISMLGTHVDRGFLTGQLHRNGGIVFFLIALALILLAIWLLRKSEYGATRSPKLLPVQTEPLPFSPS